MKLKLSVSPRKEMKDSQEAKKTPLTSAGIEPTTSVFDKPLLYRLSYEARREQVTGLIRRLLALSCVVFHILTTTLPTKVERMLSYQE